MSSPIGFREFHEDEYRKFIRTLSEEELIKAASGDLVYNVPVRMLVDESVFNNAVWVRLPHASASFH
jgi:hypothetical protein